MSARPDEPSRPGERPVPRTDPIALPSPVRRLADALGEVPGVVGVVLGGSRARGTHTAASDWDLGVLYRPPLDVDAVRRVVAPVDPRAVVTAPGEWGPWVDGGAWLHLGGVAVDLLYRDVDRVRASWDAAVQGRVAFHTQVGHPLGVPDHAYAGELALARVLCDPTGLVNEWHTEMAGMPPALRSAMVAGLWEAEFLIGSARKAAGRGDTAFVAGSLFRALGVCAHALHGRAGRWVVHEKGLLDAAGALPGAPANFAERAQAVLAAVGRDPGTLTATLDAAEALVGDVRAALADSGRP